MASPTVTATLGCFPRLESVDSSLVGEDEKAILAEAGEDGFREILIFRGDAFEAFSSTILHTECFNGKMSNVIVL